MSSNDLERVNRRRTILAIVTVWLVTSVFMALGAMLEPRVFALITPPSLQFYSGDTGYQVYFWEPQRRPYLEIAKVRTALTVGLLSCIATFIIWKRLGFPRRSIIIASILMALASFLGIKMFLYLVYTAPLVLTVYSLVPLPKSPGRIQGVDKPNDWRRVSEAKKWFLQTVIFVLLAVILFSLGSLVYNYIAYRLFAREELISLLPPLRYERVPGTDSPIVWLLAAAIPLIGGSVPYVIWRKVWGTSQNNAVIIGNLMAIPLALWMSGAAALALTTGLLVYVSPLDVEERIAVQTGVTCLVMIALGVGWETAFVMFMALGLYIIWLYIGVPLVEAGLVSLEPDNLEAS